MSRPIARRLVRVVVACATMTAAPAAAEPVRIEVHTACPDEAQLRAALRIEGLEADPSAARTVRVVPAEGGGARLVLTGAEGRGDERVIASDDCAALAAAFALIARAFVDGESTEAAPPALETPPPRPLELALAPAPPPAPATAPVVRAAAPRQPAPWRFALGFSGGLSVALAPGDGSGFAQVDVLAARPESRHALRLALGRAAATEVGGAGAVSWQHTTARLELSTGWQHRALWLRLGAGAGGAVAVTRAPGVDGQPRLTRALPLVSGSLMGGLRLGGAWSARAELGASLFPLADRYVTETMGEVGRSPRAAVALGLGLELETNR